MASHAKHSASEKEATGFSRPGQTLVKINGNWIGKLHTVSAYIAFVGALVVGIALHYKKIVENEYYGYPQEWLVYMNMFFFMIVFVNKLCY